MAFARLEPFGSKVEDLRAGEIAAAAANAYHYKLKRPAAAADFFPSLRDQTPAAPAGAQTQEEQMQILRAFNDGQRRDNHS